MEETAEVQVRRFTAGSEQDPREGLGRCLACPSKIVNYQEATGLWVDVSGQSHTGHEIELKPATLPGEISETWRPESLSQRVRIRVTDAGYYYRVGEVESDLCTVQDEQNPDFERNLAKKLGVEVNEILKARLWEIQRPTTFQEISDVLSSTVRQDLANKLILFCAGILTFTREDQINVLMSGESSGGKSYNALEAASYFPKDVVMTIATASPKAFYHQGVWDEDRHLLVVDLRGKIIAFLDQPHYMLMEALRPLASHDQPELVYKIADKNRKGQNRTKTVLILGFPSLIFCAAKLSLEDQERTRSFVLSPETTSTKLEESLRLLMAKVGNREAFKQWLESHPRRRWLKARIEMIRQAGIEEVIVPDQEQIYRRFLGSREHLAPRHQRDLPKILALIKAHALLNWAHRKHQGSSTIEADREDIEAGFWLYGLVAEANELGLSPQVYEMYRDIIKPNLSLTDPLRKERIAGLYFKIHGRRLGCKQLEKGILPALEASGVVSLQPDPSDRRRIVVYPPDEDNISPPESSQNNVDHIRGVPLSIGDTATKLTGRLDTHLSHTLVENAA